MSSDTLATPVPAALPAMWRVFRRGYRAEPWLMLVALGLTLLAAVPDALLALWLKLLVDGVTGHDHREILLSAIGLGVSSVATWYLKVVSDRIQRRFRDKVTIALESHVARLQASVAGIEHHERPDYLDRLEVLRNQVFVLDHIYMSLFSTAGWIIRLGVTIGLLVSIHPVLGLLAAAALPTVFTSTWRPGIERAAEESGAQSNRLARHLFLTATTAAAGKEVRVTGIGPRLVRDRRTAWEGYYRPVSRARWGSAVWHTVAWTAFGVAYVSGIAFVATRANAQPGNVLMALAAGARLSAYVGATVGEIGFLRGIWLDGSKRLAWLEDYATAMVADADLGVPDSLSGGITLEHVSFRYPGTERLVLDDVSLHLPAGAVVALVGENGAGKTTLVKLLCRFYQPTSGRILVDGADLARLSHDEWRSRLGGTFQDFFRFELRALNTVGLGDPPRIDDAPAVGVAVSRAGADDVIAGFSAGLDTQLGPTWPDGVEVSFGQWQKLSLARGFMRDDPLLLVLDEPAAALDAETEHALFDRYARAARSAGPSDRQGRITLLVSHRFSTIHMADLIVVLDGARLVEHGSHEDLMAARGQYAELYGIQAAAYR